MYNHALELTYIFKYGVQAYENACFQKINRPLYHEHMQFPGYSSACAKKVKQNPWRWFSSQVYRDGKQKVGTYKPQHTWPT